MFKTLLLVLLPFSLVGCHNNVKPPKIKVIAEVESATVELTESGLSFPDAQIVLKLVRQLRKSESYYIKTITQYNSEFAGDE